MSFKARIARWLYAAWHGREQRVLGEYNAIGKLALTDIALRGGVFSQPARAPGDVFGDGMNEGRRQMALEILNLAQMRQDELWALMPKAPTKGDRP